MIKIVREEEDYALASLTQIVVPEKTKVVCRLKGPCVNKKIRKSGPRLGRIR